MNFEFSCSNHRFHERMLDDQDDAHSIHSVGVVENPLYADHEEYDLPKAKEVSLCLFHGKK